MHLRFQDSAETDLLAIKLYIEPESPRGLERVLTAILPSPSNSSRFRSWGVSGL